MYYFGNFFLARDSQNSDFQFNLLIRTSYEEEYLTIRTLH
jgi:hypothetical protein